MASQKKAQKLHSKRPDRRMLTWMRMCRYGMSNFSRNAWLTTAATAIMTITLLILFTTAVTRNILTDTVDNFRSKVDISIYLRNSVTDQQVEELEAKLLAVDEQVKGVRYIDLDQARQDYIDKENPTPEQLQAISELSTTPFPPSLRVSVVSPDRIDQIEQLVETDEDFQNLISPTSPPSYAGDRREAIESIGRAARFTDTIGIVAGLTFTAISMLIIFNTIRMAIFNRRDEIQMMKLIGADKRFIRGPFVVEAVMYGIIAAFLATALGYAAVFAIEPQLNRYDVIVSPTRDLLTFYSPVVVVAMALIGSIIGAVSSRFAVRRYLSV